MDKEDLIKSLKLILDLLNRDTVNLNDSNINVKCGQEEVISSVDDRFFKISLNGNISIRVDINLYDRESDHRK